MSKKRGLSSKGVNALFSKPLSNSNLKADALPDDAKLIRNVDINLIEPDKMQPRFNFDEDSLEELSLSIKQYGVLQPLLVKKNKDRYIIIAGERRWRASKIAGLKELPIIENEVDDERVLEISLIENIQREDLNIIEEAKAYKRLQDEYGFKQDEIAEKVNKSRSAITNSLRLLNLDARVIDMIVDEMISSGHGRALLAIDDKEEQFELANKIFDDRLSVREIEKIIKNSKLPKKEVESRQISRAIEDLQNNLIKTLSTKVTVKTNKKDGGKLIIDYYSDEDLLRIVNIIEEEKNNG